LPEEDLGRLVRRLDPDRWLASRFIADEQRRADVLAVLALDAELARAARVASNPLIAEIRLAWWREGLDEIYQGRAPRRQPVLNALAAAIARHGLERDLFGAMIEARINGQAELTAWADATAGSVAVLSATVLDPAAPRAPAELAGRAWGLLTLRRSAAVPRAELDPLAKKALAAASVATRRYSTAAFPVVACAALIGPELRSDRLGELHKRLRLLAAIARGRI